MKIAIIGAGAMGSLYGGILAETGNDVYFVDVFEEHVNAINDKGLSIITGDEERNIKNVKAVVDSKDIKEKIDLIIVFVKSTLTDIGIKGNKNIISEDTVVLTLQNGMGNIEKINKYVDKDQIIVGTSANGASFVEPGKIRHSGHGGTVLGEIDGRLTDRIKKIHKVFDVEGLGGAELSESVMSLIWEKLIVNCGINPLTALTGLKNGEILENEESLRILENVVEEALEVAKAVGIKLSFEDSSHCKAVAKATAENTSSMLADIENKRRTEIDNINGAVVRIGKKHNIETSVNSMLTDLILLKEKCY